ncbi:hypothetical protein OsJ_07452 [Oryza sativa Japonica Group]|uniref:EF-hand domain-containing protein n=1 Tax=Oryza sativa subsp. japonica TaxID=39947 RepID=A3A8V9_ORYSJ|nr:hypothetical protein OsJ_07452 [Oryza sativa Japonica Group]
MACDQQAELRRVFELFDRDGDGRITRGGADGVAGEARDARAQGGARRHHRPHRRQRRRGRTAEDCGRMIGQVDRDGDGRVDFLEFKQMMRGGAFATLR